MVDKDEGLLKFAKDKNVWKMMLQSNFPELVYKETKKEYFSDFLKNRIGIPRDPEIAKIALEHLMRIGFIKNKNKLEDVLQTPFFRKNIFNREFYVQKLEMKEQKGEFDLGSIEKQDYDTSRLEEAYKEKVYQLDHKTEEKPNSPECDQPEQDMQQDISEPEIRQEIKESRFDPWWRRLGLSSNPFPDTDGLGTIPESMHESIIAMTEIFEKYIHYIDKVPSELFKNTIFYGEFGSGKTTLFEYLQIPPVKSNIHSAIIRLSAEPDYQNFLMKFKQKFSRELIDIYFRLTGTRIAPSLEPLSLDDAITKGIKLIESTGRCNGFVIFVDDIYKPQDYEKVARMFLNNLQTFTAELKKEMVLPNIGFFISLPLEWESILKDNQVYSGSVTWEEHMPLPTVEEASKMFNERLAAFAITKEKCGHLEPEVAEQVYRTLISRKAFTFRNFIKECLRRFEGGDLGILIANPVSINDATLKNILELLRDNSTINDGINEILTSSMKVTSKAQCFQLLVQIFMQKHIDEDSVIDQSKFFYFNALKNAGLVTKSRSSGEPSWNISKELIDFNTFIQDKFRYSLDDYFLKLFEKRLELKIDKSESEKKEFTLIEKLIVDLRNRSDNTSSSVRFSLHSALGHHKQIVLDIDRTSNRVSFNKLKSECLRSIRSLSNAVAIHAGLPANGIEFWNDFWHYPDSLDNFLKVRETQSSAIEPSNIYLFSAYQHAFTDIANFLSDQIEKNAIMTIPATGLKNEEIREFDTARDDYRRTNYTSAARRISSLVENKLREFIYSVFVLQYGDSSNRFQRIPIHLHSTIKEHMNKDKQRGLTLSKNELIYLNRQHYYSILADKYGIGYDNWISTFSKIFAGWNVVKMRDYLYSFKELNLSSAHNKEVFTAVNQSEIYQYIVYSIWLIAKINGSYFTFLETVKKAEIPGSTEIGYYFSLDDNKYSVQPDLLGGNTSGVETKVVKKNEPVVVLKVR